MSARHPQRVTLRVTPSLASMALEALLNRTIDEFPLSQLAAALAASFGAALDGLELDVDPERVQLTNRVDLVFQASPDQRCRIEDALRSSGFDVVGSAPMWGNV